MSEVLAKVAARNIVADIAGGKHQELPFERSLMGTSNGLMRLPWTHPGRCEYGGGRPGDGSAAPAVFRTDLVRKRMS